MAGTVQSIDPSQPGGHGAGVSQQDELLEGDRKGSQAHPTPSIRGGAKKAKLVALVMALIPNCPFDTYL